MKTRVETIVTIDRAWAAKEGQEEIDIILPQNATDWMVTEYDCVETLYVVINGKLHQYNLEKRIFEECGENKPSILSKCITY